MEAIRAERALPAGDDLPERKIAQALGGLA